MLKNKKTARLLKIIASLIVTIISPCIEAEVTNTPIEIKCSENPLEPSEVTFDGKAGVQYTVTTLGLKDAGREEENIIKVLGSGLECKTHYGLHVHVTATCIPSYWGKTISSTDSTITCDEGEAINIIMIGPNNNDPNQYRYSGMLTTTRKKVSIFDFDNKNMWNTLDMSDITVQTVQN